MSAENYNRYFDILELRPDASLSEIRNAYLHLKELYSSDSIVTVPVADEFSEESRAEVLHQIEEAYANLAALFRYEFRGSGYNGTALPAPSEEIRNYIAGITLYNGQVLREIRQKRRVELCEIAASIKIGKSHLENIEKENFEALPPEVYLKGFVSSYAKYLSLDSRRVVDDYIKLYQTWRSAQQKSLWVVARG
jgi:curved DNA-binding protein CbpA